MTKKTATSFAVTLRRERLSAGLTQAALARRSGVNRMKIAKIEIGESLPDWEESLQIAKALRVPLQRFLNGKMRPSIGLSGIALELLHLGIRDYVVEREEVPGAFRRPEQIIALVLRGDQPEPRLIEAMPLVLATQKLNAKLAVAFADLYDRRGRARLAWLCDVTLFLGRMSAFTAPIRAPEELEKIKRMVTKPTEPDDLGHPGIRRATPLWRRWNIAYGGTMDDFLTRVRGLMASSGSEDDE